MIGPLLGLGFSFLLLPLLGLTLVQGIELKTVDARMRLRGRAEAAPEVVICAIDARSVDLLGQWPWPRAVVADLVRRLHRAGARAIVLDVVFSEPSRLGPADDETLAQAVREAGNVVLGFYLSTEPGAVDSDTLPQPVELAVTPPAGYPEVPAYPSVERNIPILARAARFEGHFVVQPDSDGTVRHYPLILAHADRIYPSLALRAAQVFLGTTPVSVRPLQGRIPVVRLGDLEIPASERGELWVNYRGRLGETFPYLSIADVVSGSVPEARFGGRLVMVGASETGIADLKTTPFDNVAPGIEVHASAADNLLHRRFIRDGAVEAILGIVAILVLGPLCGWMAGLFRRPLTGTLATAGCLVLYVVAAQVAFSLFAMHVFLVVPLLAGASGYSAAAVFRNIYAEANARLIRRAFRQFVSEPVMVQMLRDPDSLRLSGEKREMTVLFSDIRGFTSLSERLPPERVVSILNGYLTPMTRILLDHGGTLDKYMGDAIMAFFGAPLPQPDHAARACAAAFAMQARLRELNAAWSAAGMPVITCGIGLNSGQMAVGNMGSHMLFDYTVVGDQVNLGAKVEGLTRVYGVEIAVSQSTEAATRGQFRYRELDRVRVKGRQEPVRIFELLGSARPAADSGTLSEQEFLATFAAALAAYRARHFERSEALLHAALALRPDDAPSRLYLGRLAAFRSAPPADDWDGVTLP